MNIPVACGFGLVRRILWPNFRSKWPGFARATWHSSARWNPLKFFPNAQNPKPMRYSRRIIERWTFKEARMRLFCPRSTDCASAQGSSSTFKVKIETRPHFNARASNQDGDAVTALPSYLSHPAIAQREVLRQFYLSTSTVGQLAIVQSATEHIDVDTSLHLLCHAADLSIKGQLQGTTAQHDALVHAIVETLGDAMPTLSPPKLGALLWGVASVPGIQADWRYTLLEDVASREANHSKVQQYNTKEVANILFAAGRLSAGRSMKSSPIVSVYAEELVEELLKRMDQAPYVRSSFTAADFSDLAGACAALHVEDPPLPSSHTVRILNIVAAILRRQLSNRHSGRAAFTCRELIRLLESYAALQIRSGEVSAMLDAIAGFVSNRIRDRHLNAVTRPADIAAVLQAYAALYHHSVAVPELLTSMGDQLRQNAAQMHERLLVQQQQSEHDSAMQQAHHRGQSPDVTCSVVTLVTILDAHLALGFSPDALTLHAVLPGIRHQLSSAHPRDIVRLLELLAVLNCNPGAGTVALLAARVADAQTPESDTATELYGRVLRAAAALHCTVPPS